MIALILARGGSKRVPQKNIKPLNDIPLIGYVIMAANKSKLIDKVYVSTDDKDIKTISKKYGAIVIDRPSEFAKDNSTDIGSFIHFVNETGYSGDIVHLRTTTPLIIPNVLDRAITYYLKNDCTSMRSAHESSRTAYKCFKQKGKYWGSLFDNEMNEPEYYNLPNQELPKTYSPNGYVDIVKTECFMDGKSMHGNKILSFITEFTHDIDTQEDFDYIEFIMNRNKKDNE